MDYEPGTPSFSLNEIALHIRAALKYTEGTAANENLIAENMDVQFPCNPSYRQFKVWADEIERARDILSATKNKS